MMSAETLQAHAHPDDAAGASRARARLEAHRLVQRVQIDDCAAEVAERLATAEARGWSDVVRLLLYADLVQAWTVNRADYDATIQRLHDRAEARRRRRAARRRARQPGRVPVRVRLRVGP